MRDGTASEVLELELVTVGAVLEAVFSEEASWWSTRFDADLLQGDDIRYPLLE